MIAPLTRALKDWVDGSRGQKRLCGKTSTKIIATLTAEYNASAPAQRVIDLCGHVGNLEEISLAARRCLADLLGTMNIDEIDIVTGNVQSPVHNRFLSSRTPDLMVGSGSNVSNNNSVASVSQFNSAGPLVGSGSNNSNNFAMPVVQIHDTYAAIAGRSNNSNNSVVPGNPSDGNARERTIIFNDLKSAINNWVNDIRIEVDGNQRDFRYTVGEILLTAAASPGAHHSINLGFPYGKYPHPLLPNTIKDLLAELFKTLGCSYSLNYYAS
jgi:hypothetical protein